MPDILTVKIQLDASGTHVLIYDVPEPRSFSVLLQGVEARRVAEAYDLQPLTRVHVRAEVDENGLLTLGEVLEDVE
jgi:hypothetical protein